MSALMSTNRTSRPLSRASSSHGETFASWSSLVQTISSPGSKSRPAVRERAKLSVVMFGPKTISSGAQPRNRPAVSRAFASSASVRRLVSYGPLVFAFEVRK